MFDYTKEFINIYREAFGENVVAILQTGSRFSDKFIKGWSDADYIVVFEELTHRELNKVHALNKFLEVKYGFHFGTSPIPKSDFATIKTNSLKILLIKMNLNIGLTRVVYGYPPSCIPTPASVDGDFWLHEINYFKDYLRVGVRDLEGLLLEKRCIKCAEYLLLVMCLYFGELPKNIDEKIDILIKRLPNFAQQLESLLVVKEMKVAFSKEEFKQDITNAVIDSLEAIVEAFYQKEGLYS